MGKNNFKQSPFVESVAIRAKYFPKNVWAVVFGDEKINWETLYTRVKRLANAMKDKARVKKGDKVAFIFHNSPQFLEINFAAQMLGAIPVPVNYRYVPSEYEYTINDCDAAVVICEDSVVDVIAETKPKLTKVRLFAADVENPPSGFVKYSDLINYPKDKEIKTKCTDDDVGVIIYTGGTTGRSKGVMLTNRNLLTNQEAILRSFLTELPAYDKSEKFSKSEGELKYLKAFDLFNTYFEGYFKKKPKDVVSLLMRGNEFVPDLTLAFAYKEGQLKIMYSPDEIKKGEAKLRIRAELKESFRTILNLLPLVYTGSGRRKALGKAGVLVLSRRLWVNLRLFRLLKFAFSLMKKTKGGENVDRSQEFLSLYIVPPMFHLAAYAFFLMFSTYAGGMCILPRDRSFSPEDVLKTIEQHKPKWILLVPTMYRETIEYVKKTPNHGHNISSVRIALSGASLLKAEDKKNILTVFPNSIVVDAFGQTEMAAISSLKIDVNPNEVKQGSVGKMGIGIEVRIVKDDGTPAKDEEIGEIYYRSKTVMKGYYGDAEKTAKTIDKDGWLHSGDLGYLKNGELYTVDRKGECINSGGEKVFPIEVEEVMHEHPAVQDVCIIGIPDEKWGSTVRAIVVLKENQSCTDKEIIDWCNGKMAGFKKPRSVIFIDKLPINPVGKVMRGEIKKKYGQKVPTP